MQLLDNRSILNSETRVNSDKSFKMTIACRRIAHIQRTCQNTSTDTAKENGVKLCFHVRRNDSIMREPWLLVGLSPLVHIDDTIRTPAVSVRKNGRKEGGETPSDSVSADRPTTAKREKVAVGDLDIP
jgi:hypothetical protein